MSEENKVEDAVEVSEEEKSENLQKLAGQVIRLRDELEVLD